MEILVLASNYTDLKGRVSLHYIHTRNLEYIAQGMSVTVINFAAKNSYELDGVKVITLKEYENNNKEYDLLLSHAPNIRQHYKFLKKNRDCFENTLLFFHGHEVLRISEDYPEPYPFMKKKSLLKRVIQDAYDTFKFRIWRKYLLDNQDIHLVFVSNWMLDMFLKHLKLTKNQLAHTHIIYNSVGEIFEVNSYTPNEIEYDFITIRSNLDMSKYCIDVVCELAERLPDKKFKIIGVGDYFKHNTQPENVSVEYKNLAHHEIIEALDKSRFALLPTRTDSQGVMACEMITYGIPLITSEIQVTREIFKDVENVILIKNNKEGYDSIKEKLNAFQIKKTDKLKKFSKNRTLTKEIALIESLYSDKYK